MLLVKRRAIQHLIAVGLVEVHTEFRLALEREAGIALGLCIRPLVAGEVLAHRRQTLDVAGASSDNVHWVRWVVESCRVSLVEEHGVKALGVVDVAEERKVDAVFVEHGIEGDLAGGAHIVKASGRIPRTMAGGDEPWSDAAVHAGEVCFEEVDLLLLGTKRTNVQIIAAVVVG